MAQTNMMQTETGGKAPATREAIFAEVDDMLETCEWDGVTAKHLVALYDRMHTKCYGVRPTDAGSRAERAAVAIVEREFGGDYAEAIEFARWFWTEEMSREKWRRDNGREGKRADWRAFFDSSSVTNYRVSCRRHGKPASPAPEVDGAEAASEAEPIAMACTDLGNAQRLAARHGHRLRHTGSHGWFVYDGRRWKRSESGEVERLAKETARAIHQEAADVPDARDAAELGRHAIKSQSARALAAMISLAKSEPEIAITIDAFDRDPMLLNTPSGTVDLRTGELRPHDPADMLTRMTSAPFDAAARSLLWERTVSEAMGHDEERVAFLQRALGYAATGSTAEEKLFMPIGPGGTSKSTVFGAVRDALGDYAAIADFEAFIAQKNSGGPRNDIARLRGARFVLSIEVEEGRKLAEGLVKSITGGDAITARFLYGEAFEFKPQLTLVLVANEPPRVNDLDSGMWRRILRIPFEQVVPKDKRDPKVKATLCDPSVSGAAILAWLVKGALEWQRVGLAVPASIEAATEAYRESQDPLADFFGEECTFAAGAWVSREQLRKAYEAWAKEAGGRFLVTPRTMVERCERRGLEERKRKGVRGWRGIALRSEAERAPFFDWPTAQQVHRGERSTNVDEDARLRARAAVDDDDASGGHLCDVEGHQGGTTIPRNSRAQTLGGHMGQQVPLTSLSTSHGRTLGKVVPLGAPCPPPRKRSEVRIVRGGAS